ncbi:LysR substrate-binding domain-containing protein [Aurantiacibacter sp. MUD61]|uniref:LysR substrate-binding domain-containing protein n=1 Tax=Aurantiacibacter sp. MUD61 TaxID=3009083 RepID=UPI0022F06FDF|nr:LysR substrate-binding domain-containing protein [Aurantiacibacter sp. MUD61]
MRNLPPLSAIRGFEAAARHKNFTRAGEELGLTQAAVSYQIKNLEQRVGMPLFVREGRTMELTAAGEALAPQIAHAFTVMQNAFDDLGGNDDAVLSIACFQSFAAKVLAPRLGKFQLANPQIALRLEVSNSFVDLEAGECDVAIRLSHSVPKGLEQHPLMQHEIAAFATPDFIAANPQFAGDDPALPDDDRISPGSSWWDLWDAARCDDRKDKAATGTKRGLQFDSQVLDAAAAASGNGVALLSPELFHAEIENGALIQVGSRVLKPDAQYRLIYPEVRRNSEKVRAFRIWLLREFADAFGESPGSG